MRIVSRMLFLTAVGLGLAAATRPDLALRSNPRSNPLSDPGTTTLSSVQQVTAIGNARAALKLPVKLKAVVTYVRPAEKAIFIMEDGFGLYVRFSTDLGLLPGDRIEVEGVTAPSFKPIVVGTTVRFLAHGSLPEPKSAVFADLIQSKLDCQYVQISGRVLSASLDDSPGRASLRIRIQVPLGTVRGIVVNPGKLRPEDLLDSDVRLRGVVGGEYDGKMQLSGAMLDINSSDEVTIVKQAPAGALSIPAIPMDEVVSAMRYSNQSQRVHITGTLTYYEPSTLAVLETQGRSMLVKSDSTMVMHTGMAVDATGYPAVMDESVGLENAQLRPSSQAAPAVPRNVHWEEASVGQYTFDLVSMEGEVVGVLHDSRVDLFLIREDGHLFSATLRHTSSDANDPDNHAADAPTPTIGSRVRVTGVCFVDAGNHWRDRLWFDLRMRSLNDMTVLQPPSWWTVKRLAYIATGLSVVILIAVIWAGLLDRRLRKQTAILARQSQEDAIRQRRLARQEQQRSHILELISSREPLPEVLREIQSMVSSRLFGAPCWFELNTRAGDVPELDRPAGPAIVFQEMFAPDGTSLGFLMASPVLASSVESDISAALVTGARLAELAIDTRRLYADLRRRSEYDLLTDIPNRFSMEKRLDQLMSKATGNEGLFGLIYVDLDRFKQINDRYGHRTGDLYLQEVTRRMKLQLRNDDALARIGGDEFIALVPILRSHNDAEEIAIRLERCFDEPFQIEGYVLRGSASVGLAVYPEDGATKEELQRSADAAMYANKELRRKQTRMTEELLETRSADSADSVKR